ncbi:MAG: hypothetical protein IKD10_06335 [Lentisphaeria bacterium]|nr:hypothetical protein [Lentisphaerota bacterium]MBR7144546.1 hypothetical protein [Lentisphaeria bacterium]
MLKIVCPAVSTPDIEVAKPFEKRLIKYVFHDIDGTHSLIRDWVPVMTLVTGAVATYGMFPGSPAEAAKAIAGHSPEEFPEARRFAIESAGLSALTQMEWALRMSRRLDNTSTELNEKIIQAIWQGKERFEDAGESPEDSAELQKQSSELFHVYEILLLEMCRNRNLAAAKLDPAAWQVPGSMEFLQYLYANGVKNYFVTGAVVEYDARGNAAGSMAEEVTALGYEMGSGKLIEKFCGSTWQKKLPKVEIMRQLCQSDNIAPENLLIAGDGRSEIAAAVELGAIALSRLDMTAARQREIHRKLGTNLIIPDYRKIRDILIK